MADSEISAALAGQQGTPAADPAEQQTATPQGQPQGTNYVTSEQLNAVVDELKRTIQSSTDKSYNRVQKMIDNLKQAGIQNPTYEQAKAMLSMQDQSEPQETAPAAQPQQSPAGNPEVVAWIQKMGGDPSVDFWTDIYDAAQEAGVENITRNDPEYEKYFLTEGKLRDFEKPRHFVRAFEQAFAEKAQRLKAEQQGSPAGNPASSPALASIGNKSSFIDPKSTSANNLISDGLHQNR